MTPFERAARAIYVIDPEKGDHFRSGPGGLREKTTFDVPWEETAEDRRQHCMTSARAVLTAIREPSEGMVEAEPRS